MIVYRHEEPFASWKVRAEQVLWDVDEVRHHLDLDSTRQLLIDFGELESGVTDAVNSAYDAPCNLTELLRGAGLRTGRLAYQSWRGWKLDRGDLDAIASAISALDGFNLPSLVPQPISEGYAYYSLYPEMYIEAAERELPVEPGAIVCIGIRSIGTSLSSAVAAVAEAKGSPVWSITMRPRGHPWQRTLALHPDFERELHSRIGALYCIVDEGPGLSGSSFASVFNRLCQLGVPPSQILLFPSSNSDAERLRSENGRRVWSMSRKAVCSFEETWPDSRQLGGALGFTSMQDISSGRWRQLAYETEESYPAVQPYHERRKYLCGIRSSPRQYLLKFEGLGRYGAAIRQRADELAAGHGQRPLELSAGFLMSEYVSGAPLGPGTATGPMLEIVAQYLATVNRSFPDVRPVPWTALMEMVRTNTSEALAPAWTSAVDELERFKPLIAGRETAAIDGRMFPHEWIETADGLMKTDALHHHCDHFFPGSQDIAWDIAATVIEFRLDPSAATHFATYFAGLDDQPDLDQRLLFYTCAYLAYRLGYASLATESLASCADQRRFAAQTMFYRAALKAAIAKAIAPKLRANDKRPDPRTSSALGTMVS